MADDPVGAMATALRQSLETQDFVQGEGLGSVTLDGVFDLNELARAAWRLALDVLNKPSEGMKIEAFGYSTVDDVLTASIDQARREILGE